MSSRSFTTAALIALFLLTLSFSTSTLWADGFGGYGHHGGGRYFDPSTVTTLSGELVARGGDWAPWGHGNHTGGGVHFEFLADDGEAYELMLAPSWFLEENGIFLQEGDRITVTGSIVAPYGDPPGDGGLGATGAGHGHGPGDGGGQGPGGHGPGPGDGQGPGNGGNDHLIVTVLTAGDLTVSLRNDDGYPLWRGELGPGDRQWFDPDTVTTLSGTLRQLLGLWSPWGHGNHTGSGIHYLYDSTEGETFYAMLGPWWYLEDQGVELADGIEIEITGSVVEPYWDGYDDYRYLIATEVAVGELRVALRDEYGYPLWRGTGCHYHAPAYDPASEAAPQGVVARTQTRAYGKNLDPGYEVILRADGERYVVFLAPQWHVEARGLSLASGQRIEVHGALIRNQERRELVARYVTVDGKTWRLRNARGVPVWIQGAR